MKKSIYSILLLSAMLALISVSCKSAPPPEPEQSPEFGGLSHASPEALKGPMARAEEARKRAMDFESPSYFPSDWEAAETQYAAAANMNKSTESEIEEAIDAYNAIADTYDELFKKTIPLYAQAREDEIIAVRDELTNTGFANFVPEYLQNADQTALAALEQYEAEDYYKARDTAAAALKDYETLLMGSKVYSTRQEIIDRGFNEYDPENFDKADEVAQAAIDEYEVGNKENAISNTEEALLRYNILLTNGWTKYAADRRTFASTERELALADKANIAVREAFREADAVYNQAEDNFSNEKFNDAAILFTESEALFAVARKETEEKRQKALETIKLAEEKIEESDETAIEAERIIEGGSR